MLQKAPPAAARARSSRFGSPQIFVMPAQKFQNVSSAQGRRVSGVMCVCACVYVRLLYVQRLCVCVCVRARASVVFLESS